MKKSGRSSQAGDIRAPEYEHPSTATRSPLPQRERQRGGASPPQKEANPASLRSAAPSKGRGSRGHSLLPMEGGAPKGRRLAGKSGMKKSGKDRLKCVVYESTLSTAARSPFPNGEGYDTRVPLSPYHQSEYMHVWKNNIPDTKPSPRGEGGERSEPDRVLAA